MKKITLLMLLLTISFATNLESGKAYIVSSININSSGNVETGKSYSLVPQVIVATGSENYVGSVTMFTGCYNGKRYEEGVYKSDCSMGVVDSLVSTSTTDSLSANQGKIINDKVSNLESRVSTLETSGGGVNASEILDLVYPVGSIYMSASNVSPAAFLGGEWTALDEGRVLIGANSNYTAGSTGGSTTNNHTHNVTTSGTIEPHKLTISEMPSHSHSYYSGRWYYNETPGGDSVISSQSELSLIFNRGTSATGGSQPHSHNFTGATVTSTPATINNMQPYLAVYMWQRTK